MSIEVKVPILPESVADATVAAWHKKVGDKVTRDENLVDLETDKVVLEVPAPVDGILKEIRHNQGDVVGSGELLAIIMQGGADTKQKTEDKPVKAGSSEGEEEDKSTSPAVRRMMAENDLQAEQIKGTGKEGRITKEDVIAFIESTRKKSVASSETKKETKNSATSSINGREEKRVPMSRLRAMVAKRLVQAQHEAAMLTTFNEVNLKAVMDIRAQYKDSFEKKHGIKLGFMSFFTKAVVEALKRFPAVNASIDGQDVVYHGYFDIGIAVSTERGLVVPVIRDADQLSMAEIESTLHDLAIRARR